MRKQAGFSVVEAFVVLVVIGAVGFSSLYVLRAIKNHHKTTAATTASKQATTTSGTDMSAGSSNSDLNSDLSSITASQSQSDQSSGQAATAVNDQQKEVTVPTN